MGNNVIKKSRIGFLAKLLRDQAGNTIALMAAGLVPLTAMIGGGVDVSRIYLVQTRLQQACDAGALAGRKTMGASSWNTASNTAAQNMFGANWTSGSYGSGSVTRSFTESGGTVTGNATLNLPMAVMKMFGTSSRTITVACTAEMAIPNTDVMFVLDVTGSMGSDDGSGSKTKINGLKEAVNCFYEALSKQDTTTNCGSTPSGTSQSAQIRYGFVPYAVNVNVGKLLPQNFMADSWTYQSRVAVKSDQNVVVGYDAGTPYVYDTSTSYTGNWGSWTTINSYNNIQNSSACNDLVPADYTTYSGGQGAAYDSSSWISGGYQITRWYTDENGTTYNYSYSYKKGKCDIERRNRPIKLVREYRRQDSPRYEVQLKFSHYEYKPVTFNISALKNGNGTSWNSNVTLPVGTEGLDRAVAWDGCIEERQTVHSTTSYYPIPSGAKDLDIRLVPTADNTTRWAPILPNAVWGRASGGSNTVATVSTSSDLSRNYGYSCPTEAAKLATYPTAGPFQTYVNGLSAGGRTYHDAGLIWGARLLSRTGIFAAENDNQPNIQRHLVFMTDGDTVVSTGDYTPYGIEWWDRRRNDSSPDNTELETQVNMRFLAICNYLKNEMGVTLWVIGFGNDITTTTRDRLTTCASPSKYYNATNSSALITTFQGIASDISDLRLTS